MDIFLSLLIFLSAFFVNIYKVDSVTPGVWGDEITVAITGEKVVDNWNSVPFINTATGYTKPFLLLEGLFVKIFGRNLASIRLLSILFGTLDLVCFYFLLRLFFKRSTSFVSSTFMIFSYPHLVISRLAYNITASLFFQILSIIFIYLYFKENKNLYLLSLGLSLGAGLFTYVGFRTFALAALVVTVVIVFRQNIVLKPKLLKLLLVIGCLFITATSFISFSLSQPAVAMARVKSLSVFGQNLSISEVRKEIEGATFRLAYVFLFTGDPSARSNPSGVSMFDFLTTILLILGVTYLFKNNKKIFWVSLFFILPCIANDIFSLERIPEFHYYGIGHPNTYRLSGIIPIFYFWVAWSFEFINKSPTPFKKYTPHIQITAAIVVAIININRYFNQRNININLYHYNYIFNGIGSLKAAEIIKNSNLGQRINLTKSLANDPRIMYFAGDKVKINSFDPKNEKEALSTIRTSELTIIDPKDNLELARKLVSDWQNNPTLFYLKIETNPFGEADFLVFSKTD